MIKDKSELSLYIHFRTHVTKSEYDEKQTNSFHRDPEGSDTMEGGG